MPVTLETLLTSSPEVCGARLRIEGTGITVLQIATLFRQGLSAEEITREYPHAPEGGIYAALAYYLANREEIDLAIVEEEAGFIRLKGETSR